MKSLIGVLAVALAAGLAGCSGMTPQGRDTAIGAGVGAIGGNALTGGSTAGTLGGAAVGGYIGNRYGKNR
ncbi:MAG TPA: glycine zipper 2TM domain-containing protein [Rhodocyclaceae bacterium]